MDTESSIAVVPLADDDWTTLRDLRLRSLADAPTAFWATLEEETHHTRDQWMRFLGAGAWFTARRDGAPVGLAAGLLKADASDEPVVIAMWVAPDARGQGAGQQLLHAICEWARDRGSPAVTLWVTDGNDVARRMYERYGFCDTGERERLPHGERLTESRMRLVFPHDS